MGMTVTGQALKTTANVGRIKIAGVIR